MIYSRQDYKVYKDSQQLNGMATGGTSQSPALETKLFNTLPKGSLSVDWVRSLPIPSPTENKKNFFPLLWDSFVRVPINSVSQMFIGRKFMSEGMTYHVPVRAPEEGLESIQFDPLLAGLKKVTVTLVVTIHDCVSTLSFSDYGIQLGLVTKGTFGSKSIKPPVMSCKTLNGYSVNDRTFTNGGNGMITGREWRVPMKMPDQNNPPYIYAEIAQGIATTRQLANTGEINVANVFISWRYILPDGSIYTPNSLRVQPSEAAVLDKISPVVALVSEYQDRIDDQTSRAALADKMQQRWNEYNQQAEIHNQQADEQTSPKPLYKNQLSIAEMNNNKEKILRQVEACTIGITSTYGLHEIPSWNEHPYMRQGSVTSPVSPTEPAGQTETAAGRGCFPLFKCYERKSRPPASAQAAGGSADGATSSVQGPETAQGSPSSEQGGGASLRSGGGSLPRSASNGRKYYPKHSNN